MKSSIWDDCVNVWMELCNIIHMGFHIYNDCHHFRVLENLKKKKLLGYVKKNTFCVQMGDWTQNMIFLMTCIEWYVSIALCQRKFLFLLVWLGGSWYPCWWVHLPIICSTYSHQITVFGIWSSYMFSNKEKTTFTWPICMPQNSPLKCATCRDHIESEHPVKVSTLKKAWWPIFIVPKWVHDIFHAPQHVLFMNL